jgi:hypothetical protein
MSDFTYTLSGGNATITGYTGAGGAVTVPSTIDGYPVIAIGDNAFYGNALITHVIISSGITTIGQSAFSGCPYLVDVIISATITHLGNWAINYCPNLLSVTFLGSVPPSLDGGVFDGEHAGFIIYYQPGPLWTNPWHGYPTSPILLPDGKMRFTDNNGNTVDVTIPEYGYKSVISFPFDIDTLDTGIKTVFAYDNTLDKYHCECDLILNETDMLSFNSWMKDAALGRAKNNCTLQMNANSGFFPFTPLHGDAGIFTVGILVSKSEKVQDNPFRYFKISISIFKQSTFPAYTLQSQINEGSLSIGTVNNIRFPESYFDSDEDNSIQSNVDESGTLNFIDRGRIASSWRTAIKLSAGTGKAAAILDYLINTARAGNFALTTQAYHYAFGRDKGSNSAYTVSLIQDSIEVTHELFNKFVFDLNVQYIAG